MARQAITAAGYVAGFYLPGGPAVWGTIGSIIGNAVDPQVIKGPRLGEGQENFSAEGGFRPIVLGKGGVGVCLIHEGPLIKRTIRQRQSKGTGPETQEQRAYRTMAFALGESAYPDTGVILLRIWVDGKLRYDVTPTSPIAAESAEFADTFTFYPGDNAQDPDPDLEAFMGAGNVPSYRGGAPYIVFPNYDVTSTVGRAPQIRVELATRTSGQKVYANAHNQSRVYISEDATTWDGAYIEPIINISAMWAGGGSVSFANTSDDRKVTFNDAEFIDIVGLNDGSNNVGVGVYCQDSGRWIVSVFTEGLYASADGINYSKVSDSEGAANCAAVRGSVVLFSQQSGAIRRSSDGGYSFETSLIHGGPTGIDAILGTSSYFFVFLGDGSVHRSPSGSDGTWVEVHESGTVDNVGGVAYDSNRDIGVVVTDDGGVWYVESGGGALVPGTDHGIDNVSYGSGSSNATFSDGYFLVGATTGAATGEIRAIEHPSDPSWVTVGSVGGSIRGLAAGYGSVSSEKILLSSSISWLHDRVNVPASKVDVSELIDEIEGVVYAGDYSVAEAIRSAMTLYFFDCGEFDGGSGYRLNYIKRGGDASVTLTEDEIIEGPEDWEREDSYERPRVLHVSYPNPVADYGAPNIAIKRTSPDVLVTGEMSVSVPYLFSDATEITRRADIMMTVVYTEIAGTYEISLPDSLIELVPTSVIGFSIRGKVRRLRMTDWRYAEGVMRTKWMADRQSAYTSDVTGLPATPSSPPPPSIVGNTVAVVMDIPALADNLDNLHLPVAATGQTDAWWGATQQRKLESDTSFTNVAGVSAPGAVVGVLQADVSAASPHYTDTTNVVVVDLYGDDEIEALTQQQFLSEGGAFALSWDDSGNRRWEIGQYRDAVKVGPRTWQLSHLARGRLNTQAAQHSAGAIFVLLDYGLINMAMQSAWIGTEITHRTFSNGQLPEQAASYSEEWTAQCQTEFPVAHLFAEIVGDDLALSCVPRHRFGTEDNPIRSANWTGYRWIATDGSNATQVDTLTDATTIDVTGWATPITVTVAQLNRFTGAGPTVTEEVS